MRSSQVVNILTIFCAITLVISSCQINPSQETERTLVLLDTVQGYDSTLAKRLGADDYGMKPYIMAFLQRGEVEVSDSMGTELQRGHLANIKRLAAEGSLVLAGPFLDTGNVRGIFIFDVATVKEAEALVASDPAIQAGTLEVSFRPWYGSAGLVEINTLHSKLAKNSI